MKIVPFFLAFTALLIATLTSAPSGAVAAETAPNEEFLQLYLELCLHSHDLPNIVKFYSNRGAADRNAVLLVIEFYDDRNLPTKGDSFSSLISLRASGLVSNFESCFNHHPTLRKRWPLDNPKANLIIRYVRLSNSNDTLAVTIDGLTSFSPSDFNRAAQRINKVAGQ